MDKRSLAAINETQELGYVLQWGKEDTPSGNTVQQVTSPEGNTWRETSELFHAPYL